MNYKIQFESRSLSVIQTVAELFIYARQEKKATLEEAANALQISPLYLEALEAGRYDRLPSFVYSQNFVKKYGQWLNLSLPPLLELFKQEWELFEKHQQPFPSIGYQEGIKKSHLWSMPRWIRWVGSSVVIMATFVYLGYELFTLRQAPRLIIDTPEEETVTDSQLVEISGKTDKEVVLSINDQIILSDTMGNFSEKVALQPGLNIVEIEAKKKYSRPNTVYRKIMVSDQPVITNTGEVDTNA